MNADAYDPRFLAGILFFNAGDFFEAHEVWEELWHEATGRERSLLQGLIQAAVGLCHYGNGNLRGAAKLHRTSLAYLEPCEPALLGLDVADLRRRLAACHAPLLADPAAPLDEEAVPEIRLDPEPSSWPDPRAHLPADDHH